MDDRAAPAERIDAVLATFDAETVHRAAAALTARDLASLATALVVPRRLLEGGAAAARVLQRRTRSLAPSNRPEVALMLAAACNDDTVTALGPKHEDPTTQDMIEVLDPIVERHGSRVVALMLAAYVDSAAPCATVFAGLLDSDERFALEVLAAPNTDDQAEGAEDGAPSVDSLGAHLARAEPTSKGAESEREARRSERKERERAAKDRRAHQAEAAEAARRRRKDARRNSRERDRRESGDPPPTLR